MIDPVTTAYIAAGVVAGATLAPFGGAWLVYLTYAMLRRETDRYVTERLQAEIAVAVMEAASHRHHLETMQPSLAAVRETLERVQQMGREQG